MTRPYLDKFLAVQPDNPWGLRNRAMLLLGYELLTRRSELVALTRNDLEILDDGTMRVIIRRSKADPFGQGRIAFTSRKTAEAVEDWLAWRGPEVNFLFCPIYRSRAVNRDLSTTTVKRLVKSAAKSAGLDPTEIDAFSGHSLRVGAPQDLLELGVETHVRDTPWGLKAKRHREQTRLGSHRSSVSSGLHAPTVPSRGPKRNRSGASGAAIYTVFAPDAPHVPTTTSGMPADALLRANPHRSRRDHKRCACSAMNDDTSAWMQGNRFWR